MHLHNDCSECSTYFSSSSLVWAKVQLVPRGQLPLSVRSRHMLILYLVCGECDVSWSFLLPCWWMNSTRPATTRRTASKASLQSFHDGVDDSATTKIIEMQSNQLFLLLPSGMIYNSFSNTSSGKSRMQSPKFLPLIGQPSNIF
jgi:hypothetical protein